MVVIEWFVARGAMAIQGSSWRILFNCELAPSLGAVTSLPKIGIFCHQVGGYGLWRLWMKRLALWTGRAVGLITT